MKKIHLIHNGKTLCGITTTVNDTKSYIWFANMKHKCKKCDKIASNF